MITDIPLPTRHSIILKTYLLILPLFLISCDKTGFFDAGETTTEEAIIQNSFSRIETASIFDVTVVNDTVNKVLVTCGENLQKYVHIEEKDGIVYISQNTKYNWSRKYEKIKLDLHVNQDLIVYAYEPLHFVTTGTFKANTFQFVDWGKFCEVDISVNAGSCLVYMGADSFGAYTIKGTCNYCEIWAGGCSKIYADSLVSDNCYVRQRGWGDVYINVLQQLSVRFECGSNVYYRGTPSKITIDNQVSGGNVMKLE
jgi:hypothetical protein